MGTQVAKPEGNGNAVAKKPATIRDIIQGEAFKQAIGAALPTHLKPDRFIRIALTAMTRTPKLAQCDQASFFNALLTLSQLGLEPDGRRAHLIPFENRKRGVTEVTLVVDYKGLVELAMRSGKVSFIHADVVCENDEFEYDRGEIKKHKIDLRNPRGEAYCVYSFVRFKDGTEKCEVMSTEDVESIRGRSRAGQSGPWVTDWREMAKKTVFRRLSKWIELSPELRDAADADDDQFESLGHTVQTRPTLTIEDLAQLPSMESTQTEDDAPPVTTEAPQENQDAEPPEQSHKTQSPPAATAAKPPAADKTTKEKIGPESPEWAKFEDLKKQPDGHNLALEIKERLGWPNTPFDKLRTAQLIALNAELQKVKDSQGEAA